MIGEKVFVYRNLHKKCFSVKSMKTGRVIAHVHEIMLSQPKFKVSEAGRERVLRTKQKNVHAGVIGYVTDSYVNFLCPTIKVTYNPYKYTSFVRQDESSISEAKIAHIDSFGIHVIE
jgi:hypothetical protein